MTSQLVVSERVRRAAGATLTGGIALYAAFQGLSPWHDKEIVGYAMAAGLTAAAIAFARRSIAAQVAARGVVWILFAEVASVLVGKPNDPLFWPDAAVVAATGLALLLTRPLLRTKEALAAFVPARFRNAFLTGAIASVSAAAAGLYYATFGVVFHAPLMIGLNLGLAAALLVAVHGFMSMRAWGALLGALVSIICIALMPIYSGSSFTLILAAAPILLLWIAPILIARRSTPARLRIADVGCVRVEELLVDDDFAEESDIGTEPRRLPISERQY